MPQDSEDSGESPILHPHIIRKLKDRNRLVDFGVRKEILSSVEDRVKQRRKPSNVADRASSRVMSDVSNAGQSVMSDRLRKGLESVSQTANK